MVLVQLDLMHQIITSHDWGHSTPSVVFSEGVLVVNKETSEKNLPYMQTLPWLLRV